MWYLCMTATDGAGGSATRLKQAEGAMSPSSGIENQWAAALPVCEGRERHHPPLPWRVRQLGPAVSLCGREGQRYVSGQ